MVLAKQIRRAGGLVVTAALAAGVVVLVLGLWRYGGPAGLYRRAHTEISSRLPHPALVPTPLPIASASTSQAARSSATPPVFQSATPHSTPTAPPIATEAASRVESTSSVPSVARAGLRGEQAYDLEVTALPTATPSPLPPEVHLLGLNHMWQTWNNCGPATLAMYLSYYGIGLGQDVVGAALRPHEDDKNVSPEELAAYARSRGLRAVARVNGNAELIRSLLAAGVPVLVETWYEPKPNDGMGHYRLLVGYDTIERQWIAYDSYDARDIVKGQAYRGIRLPSDEMEPLWAVFGRAYVVVYDELRAPVVEDILGPELNDAEMWQRARETALASIQERADDPFAWFNLGTSLVALGELPAAADAYDHSRRIGLPWRMLWYQFGPFRAYYEVRRFDEIIALADATLASAKHVEELYFWRGLAQHAKGDLQAARTSWQRAIEINPNHADTAAALATLP